MIYLKTKKEIKIIAKAGEIAVASMEEVAKNIRPGVRSRDLDKIAEEKIRGLGAEPSFQKVPGYRHSICVTPNELVVHGIPGNRILAEGDILGIDLGAYYRGFHADMAGTFPVGKISNENSQFLVVGKEALKEAIREVKVGKRIGDISAAIQKVVEGAGYSVVRELVGHGIGRQLHEDPLVPGRGKAGSGEEIKEGMVLAIEVIYNMGKPAVRLLSDGWSIATSDDSLSGLFESTVATTEKEPLVLTRLAS